MASCDVLAGVTVVAPEQGDAGVQRAGSRFRQSESQQRPIARMLRGVRLVPPEQEPDERGHGGRAREVPPETCASHDTG